MRWKASQERQQRIGQGGMTLARACVFSGAGRPAVHSKCASSVRIEEMTSPLLPGACAVTSHPFDGIRSSTSLEPCLDSYQGSSRRQNGAKAQKDRETTAGTETEDTYLFEKEGTVWGRACPRKITCKRGAECCVTLIRWPTQMPTTGLHSFCFCEGGRGRASPSKLQRPAFPQAFLQVWKSLDTHRRHVDSR